MLFYNGVNLCMFIMKSYREKSVRCVDTSLEVSIDSDIKNQRSIIIPFSNKIEQQKTTKLVTLNINLSALINPLIIKWNHLFSTCMVKLAWLISPFDQPFSYVPFYFKNKIHKRRWVIFKQIFITTSYNRLGFRTLSHFCLLSWYMYANT